ncbi:MAG: hypothetical protein ACE5JU_16630 [Candidatus Binatia bacterium]
MDEDTELIISPEILADLKARGWKLGSSGLDSVLVEEAETSAARAREAFQSGKRRSEHGASASAILCAAVACECRVSEYLTHWEFASGPLPAELAAIRRHPDALEQWRLLLRSRAPHYDLGSSRDYQHLGCLARLRDLVAHRNARLRPVGGVPEQIADCIRQAVIPMRQGVDGEWPSAVLVHEVAEWSAQTAKRWLKVADDLVPLVC